HLLRPLLLGQIGLLLLERVLDVLPHGEAVEEGRALEDHRHPTADGEELLLVETGDLLAIEEDAPPVGIDQADQALDENALPCAGAADDGQRLPLADAQREVVEDHLGTEGLVDALEADEALAGVRGLCRRGHRMVSNSLVRKKSARHTATEEIATVSVVARPTPSVPPCTCSPL